MAEWDDILGNTSVSSHEPTLGLGRASAQMSKGGYYGGAGADPSSQYSQLGRQTADFGKVGANMTAGALASSGGGTGIVSSALAPPTKDGKSWFGGMMGSFGDNGPKLDASGNPIAGTGGGMSTGMSNLQGAGTLALGLANYFTMKPVYEEQLKGMKQNRKFAEADQTRRNTTAANFDKALT